ncbi:MAG: TonB-dependent receptor [Bacteroidales bacterium]|nr:TonB-dependent receptor [Bacteroidales bacterium]
MYNKILLLLLVVLFFADAFGQKYVVNGYIYDGQTNETLIGATVYEPSSKSGTTTNAYGFYSFKTSFAEALLEISFVGYEKQVLQLTLTKDTLLNIYLNPSTTLDEVVIRDNSEQQRFLKDEIPGKIEINPQIVAKMPTLTGESDLLKALQMLPGVKSGTEGTVGLYVRGGNSDQNLYLIDGIEVYNPNHLMGFISAFNTDAIKNIDFYKGGFPAQFGGRVSSVMDIRNKDGNNEKIKGDFSIGLISAKMNLEGPIKTDKTTFSLSFRRTYLDLLLKPIIWYATRDDDDKYSFAYHFYDINAKIKHRFNPENSLTLSVYSGRDKYSFSDKYDYEDYENSQADVFWGNTIVTLDWSHKYSAQLFGNLSLSYNRYRSSMGSEFDFTGYEQEKIKYHTEYTFLSAVEDIILKDNFNYYLNAYNSFNFGVNYTHHHYTPEITNIYSTENGAYATDPYKVSNNKDADEFIVYAEDVITFNEQTSLRAGVHADYYNVESVSYFSLQPRLSFRYSVSDNLSLKAGYAVMRQNIHLLSNGLFSLPTDLWVPVTELIKPITSNQVSAGVFWQIKEGINAGMEAYYKKLDKVIDYKDGVSSFNNSENWEQKVAQGSGKAYGAELSIQKNTGRLTGWIAYTLSWSKRVYPGGEINNGKEFYDRFDVRHQFNAVASVRLSEKWDVTASFVINSGARTNVPIASYYNPMGYNASYGYFSSSELINIYGERNNFRMPSYHRLDLGFNRTSKKKNRVSIWSFNVYNAYNHKNAFFVFLSDKPNTLRAFSIMPVIPTVSYTRKFI